MAKSPEELKLENEQLAAQLEAKIHLELELDDAKKQLEEEMRSSMQKTEKLQSLELKLEHHADHMETMNTTVQDLEARNSILETSMEKQVPNSKNVDNSCVEELEQKLKASEEQLKHWETTVSTFQSDVASKLKGLKQKWKGSVENVMKNVRL